MFTSLTHDLAMNALSLLNQNTTSSDPYAKTEVITPEIAQAFLDNTKIRNRNIKKGRIDAYSKALRQGEWQVAQPISICRNGNLLDGQHRLTAIVRTGITTKMLVSYNNDPECFKVIDIGASRRHADMMQILGCDFHPTLVTSALRHYYLYTNIRDESWSNYGGSNGATPTELNALWDKKEDDLRRIVTTVKAARRRYTHFSNTAGVCFCLIAMDNGWRSSELAEFWELIKTGANLPADSIMLSYRNQLAQRSRWVPQKLQHKTQIELNCMIRAFNCWKDKRHSAKKFMFPLTPPQGDMQTVIPRSKIVRPDILTGRDDIRGLA